MSITDPDALTAIIESLGGTVVPHRMVRFDLPLSKVREAIPRLNALTGLRVEKVAERQDSGDAGSIDKVQSIATLELRRQPQEPSDYDSERNLMRAVVR
jgi:hypothetical protein